MVKFQYFSVDLQRLNTQLYSLVEFDRFYSKLTFWHDGSYNHSLVYGLIILHLRYTEASANGNHEKT